MLGRVLLRCGAPAFVRPVTRTIILPIRSYATPGRPKSVVGEPSRPVKRAVKKAAAKPADGSSPAERKIASAKRNAATKKGKKTTPKKKVLTEAQSAALKERQAKAKARKQVRDEKDKIAELKKVALSPPIITPDNPYLAFVREKNKGSGGLTSGSESYDRAQHLKGFADRVKGIGAEWKSLGAAEREHYNHLSRTANELAQAEYKRWVESHSPEEIRVANNARKLLEKKEPSKKKAANRKWPLIKDERAVKAPASSFILFSTNRQGSGDFRNISATERFTLISREWKALSESEQQKYDQLAAQDRARYKQEYQDTYKHTPGQAKSTAAVAAAAA